MGVGLGETRTDHTPVWGGERGVQTPTLGSQHRGDGGKRAPGDSRVSLPPKKGVAKPFEISSCAGPTTFFSTSTTLSSL